MSLFFIDVSCQVIFANNLLPPFTRAYLKLIIELIASFETICSCECKIFGITLKYGVRWILFYRIVQKEVRHFFALARKKVE